MLKKGNKFSYTHLVEDLKPAVCGWEREWHGSLCHKGCAGVDHKPSRPTTGVIFKHMRNIMG